jgi:hypothetical protein
MLDKQKNETAAGVDIVAMKDGKVLLIEVKKAKLHNRSWQVDAVSKKQRIVCNAIAIVLPKGMIHICPMSEHLKLCSSSGVRYITEKVNLIKLF